MTMPVPTDQALAAALRPGKASSRKTRVIVAGATGATGSAVLTQLAASPRVDSLLLLLNRSVTVAMRQVQGLVVPEQGPSAWPLQPADEGVVMFDPPRLFHGREKALWHVTPDQLPGIARWMLASGVRRLLIVMPHAQGRLPQALRQGLANLDEQAVASMGFESVIILRSAQAPGKSAGLKAPQRLAAAMLGVLQYLVPAREKAVNAHKLAEVAVRALAMAPPGIQVASPEHVWAAAQGGPRASALPWLGSDRVPRDNLA